MKNSLVILIAILAIESLFAQETIEYRSAENEFYWKNRKPSSDYWQQDVEYVIKATIDDSLDVINGDTYELNYYNNSPDTLRELYFHLFQNAFQPHSHMHDLYENNDWNVQFGEYEAKGLGTTITNLKVNNQNVITVRDNTILKVLLNEPLYPNSSLVVSCSFKTYYDSGTLRRRMKLFPSNGEKHYDGVHWYPSVAVYDRKFGWTTEQHLDKEFYHNFGQFEVDLTFPEKYIVDATGVLLNEDEVYPDSLREKIDLSNFLDENKGNSLDYSFDSKKNKTWKFRAINVHNFAFTADPNYRKGEIEWNGIKVVTLAQEKNAYKWKESGEFTKEVIRIYSEDFGMYAWPKIIVADAQDGMEYPMLTLDGGGFPGHRGLLAHEVGHMWFYGMVGSNETYRAYMDEGFTQFLTVWSMDRIVGQETEKNFAAYPKLAKYKLPDNNRYDRLYYPYMIYTWEGVDHALNTHSSDFNGAVRHDGGYGLVYFKTGVMLYNLKYVLGDDLFLKAMKYYFNKWKMCHPYPEDFRQSIIEYTKVDLNWFFDQWLETTKYIDYSIKSVKDDGSNEYEVTFERKGEMQMPLDFSVFTEDGDTLNYHIPNTWFEKETEATVLERWYGWGNLHKTYTTTIKVEGGIDNIQIDPSKVMADIDLSNNTWDNFGEWEIDYSVPNKSNWFEKEKFWRPDVWYNGFDGVQVGAHFKGNYFKRKHNYTLDIWANTTALRSLGNSDDDSHQWAAVRFYNEDYLKPFKSRIRLSEYLHFNGGLLKGEVELTKDFRKQGIRNPHHTEVSIKHGVMYRTSDFSQDLYLIYDDNWTIDRVNSYLEIEISKIKNYSDAYRELNFTFHLPGLYSDFNYSYIEVESNNSRKFKRADVKARIYGRLAYGNAPLESELGITGASPEDLFENKFTRSAGTLPLSIMDQVHIGGGLNLRGFTPVLINGLTYPTTSRSGVAVNLDLDFTKVFKKNRRYNRRFFMNTYAFSDMGLIVMNDELAGLLDDEFVEAFDVGLGLSVTWQHKYLDIQPLTIRFEFPLLYYFDGELNEGEYIVFGIGKAF